MTLSRANAVRLTYMSEKAEIALTEKLTNRDLLPPTPNQQDCRDAKFYIDMTISAFIIVATKPHEKWNMYNPDQLTPRIQLSYETLNWYF